MTDRLELNALKAAIKFHLEHLEKRVNDLPDISTDLHDSISIMLYGEKVALKEGIEVLRKWTS